MFPACLRVAAVEPILKVDKPETISNFIAISILSVFSKVFERIVHTQIDEHLQKSNFLSPKQHGF